MTALADTTDVPMPQKPRRGPGAGRPYICNIRHCLVALATCLQPCLGLAGVPAPAGKGARRVREALTQGYVDLTLLEHALASLERVFVALVATVLIGVPAGVAIGVSRVGRGILDPVIEFIRPLPPLAYLP